MNLLKNIGKNIIIGDVKIKKILESFLQSFIHSCNNGNVEKKEYCFFVLLGWYLKIFVTSCTEHHKYFKAE